MESSLKLQLDVRNNAQDLQNYMLDLNNWEEEMKKRDMAISKEKPSKPNYPPPRNKVKRTNPENEKNLINKPKKISAYDYSAWDKFDADKACDEIDNENNSEDTVELQAVESDSSKEEVDEEKEKKLSLVDEAFYEKELGNQYVKKEQWNEAIKCYTNAINLDSKNPIYYANRSLCFLKTKNLKSAEVDATVAIQLDKNYVKAYQRRAIARLALGQLQEAKSDYEEILRIEPKNALATVEISRIDEKLKKDSMSVLPKPTFNPKEIFKSEKKTETLKAKNTSQLRVSSVNPNSKMEKKEESEEKMVTNKSLVEKKVTDFKLERGDGDKPSPSAIGKEESKVFKPLPSFCKIIQPEDLPPHKRSQKALRKIPILDVDTDDDYNSELEEVEPRSVQKTNTNSAEIPDKQEEEMSKIERLSLESPKTSIQFQNNWKVLKKYPEEAYSYLRKINGNQLPEIFENSLESDFFSNLITFLASDNIEKEPEFVYDFLYGLTKVKRFSSLILFMSKDDKACIKKCIDNIEKIKSKEDVTKLLRLYEV